MLDAGPTDTALEATRAARRSCPLAATTPHLTHRAQLLELARQGALQAITAVMDTDTSALLGAGGLALVVTIRRIALEP